MKQKAKFNANWPGHAMWHYFDDGCNARGQLTYLHCYGQSTAYVLLFYILKFYHY